MQSPCRNLSGRAVTALAESKALRGKNPRQISGCLLWLPALAACVSCLGFFTFYSGYRFYILAQTYYFTYLI